MPSVSEQAIDLSLNFLTQHGVRPKFSGTRYFTRNAVLTLKNLLLSDHDDLSTKLKMLEAKDVGDESALCNSTAANAMNRHGPGARTTLSTPSSSVAICLAEPRGWGAHRADLHGAARPEAGGHNIFAPFSGLLTTASARACRAADTKHHCSTIQVSTKLLQL
jgi:hypothetical protein